MERNSEIQLQEILAFFTKRNKIQTNAIFPDKQELMPIETGSGFWRFLMGFFSRGMRLPLPLRAFTLWNVHLYELYPSFKDHDYEVELKSRFSKRTLEKMANSYFQFKKFMIHQENCGMKVSTDAMVLGALASHDKMDSILDVGTGTGVVALMLAQRFTSSEIHAVEIDKAAYDQASANIADSPWKSRITPYHHPFQDFANQSADFFDLIVSNPPYFPAHLQSKDQQRNLALHNDALPFDDLLKGVAKLLVPQGKFWVILPERQMQDLEIIASHFDLYANESVELRDRPSAQVLRVIQSFSFQAVKTKRKTLCIREADLSFSADYRKLLADFLLAF